MGYDDHTNIGGPGGRFETTQWSQIGQIGPDDDSRNRMLVGDLLGRYWKPVYCYLRQKGYGNEPAKDLTQGFFQEVVLNRKLIQQADQNRGRFRTYLLTALDRYVTSVHREQTAQKRIPQNRLVPLDRIDPGELPEPVIELTPEENYNYAWVSTLLDRMLAEVEADCRRRGLEVHWLMFEERVLKPILDNSAVPSLQELCDKYGLEDGVTVSNRIFSVKRRFQAVLRRFLRESVATDADVNEELRELIRFFSK